MTLTAEHRSTLRGAVLVFCGGAAGTLLRWGLGQFLPWPLATLACNLLGSLLIGLLAGLVPDSRSGWRRLLGTGVLGGFTTYSALATMVAHGPVLPYAALTVLGGVLLAVVGLVLGRRARAGRGVAA